MREFFDRLNRVNWFAVASLIFLIIMLTMAWPPGDPLTVAYDWMVTLGFASVVCALFAIREDLITALSALRELRRRR